MKENRSVINNCQDIYINKQNSVAMTLEDLVEDAKTRERPTKSSIVTAQQEEDQTPVVRNLHKLILDGKMAFDEGSFEFEIENPDKEELDSQLALLNHRLKVDLPNGSEYDEPPASAIV